MLQERRPSTPAPARTWIQVVSGSSRCPRCGGKLARVHRRMLDRLLGLTWATRRFRCRDKACQWQGTLYVHPHRVLKLVGLGFVAIAVVLACARLVVWFVDRTTNIAPTMERFDTPE